MSNVHDDCLPAIAGLNSRLEITERFYNEQNNLISHAQEGIEKCFDRIEALEEQAKILKIYDKPLQAQMWQENILNRLEKLEDLMKNNIDIVQRIGVFKELSERIEKLEGAYQSDFESTKEVILSLSQHKDAIKELEIQIDTVRALGSRAYHPNQPHKCPVCEGKGIVWG